MLTLLALGSGSVGGDCRGRGRVNDGSDGADLRLRGGEERDVSPVVLDLLVGVVAGNSSHDVRLGDDVVVGMIDGLSDCRLLRDLGDLNCVRSRVNLIRLLHALNPLFALGGSAEGASVLNLAGASRDVSLVAGSGHNGAASALFVVVNGPAEAEHEDPDDGGECEEAKADNLPDCKPERGSLGEVLNSSEDGRGDGKVDEEKQSEEGASIEHVLLSADALVPPSLGLDSTVSFAMAAAEAELEESTAPVEEVAAAILARLRSIGGRPSGAERGLDQLGEVADLVRSVRQVKTEVRGMKSKHASVGMVDLKLIKRLGHADFRRMAVSDIQPLRGRSRHAAGHGDHDGGAWGRILERPARSSQGRVRRSGDRERLSWEYHRLAADVGGSIVIDLQIRGLGRNGRGRRRGRRTRLKLVLLVGLLRDAVAVGINDFRGRRKLERRELLNRGVGHALASNSGGGRAEGGLAWERRHD